jgi:hypothetical protein
MIRARCHHALWGGMHRWRLLLFPILLLGGCGSLTDRSSGNQMMLVRETPGSTGYRKLMAKSRECGDLRTFIDQKGLPDFLAEANSSNRDYLIFYYLDRHQAYACRTRGKGGNAIEFAGPYAMTKGEWKLLSEVKSRAEGRTTEP